ncbi:MAG: DUF2213 domain-containing protein [Elusimicrobiaceae bacterium]
MGKIIDHNNFWYIEKNPISKTGVFPYLGREIGYPGLEPNKIYYVLRSEQELMSPEAIKSFELLPITKGHRMLGPQEQGLTPAEKIPQQGIVGEKVFAEGDTLYANIKVTSEQAKNDINNGLKELSLGYFCQWVKESGDYKGQHYDFAQKNIRGNHLAIVPLGRMGHDVRVMDALPAGADSYACDSLELAGPFVSAPFRAEATAFKVFSLPGQAQDWQESDHPRKKDGKFAPKGQGESGKAKNEEKTEKMISLPPSTELAEKFKKEVQAVLADDTVSPRTELSLGETPQIYVKLGLPKGELKTNKMTLLKALGKAGKHPHNVPIKVLEELPALITDPQAVFKSLSTSSNPSGYISVLDAVDKAGKPIIAVISPNKKDENEISFIPSVYERNNFNNFVSNVIKENGVLYIKERTVLPSLHNAVLQRNTVPTNKILTKEDFVKDLGSTKTNGTDGISAAPEDKESIKMDKRKVIEEIMAIAAKPADKFKDGKEEQIKTIAGLAEKLAYNKSERGANDEDAAKDKDKAKDEDTPSNTDKEADKKAKEACDKADKAEDAMEARIAANFADQYAKKAALYDRISLFTGSFDHLPMTLSQMAKYACDKLGIKGVAEDGAQTALEGYLVGAQKQAVVRQVKGASMDAAPESDAAFENYLKEAE